MVWKERFQNEAGSQGSSYSHAIKEGLQKGLFRLSSWHQEPIDNCTAVEAWGKGDAYLEQNRSYSVSHPLVPALLGAASITTPPQAGPRIQPPLSSPEIIHLHRGIDEQCRLIEVFLEAGVVELHIRY